MVSALLVAAFTTLVAVPAQAQTGVDVWVGYADTLRASPTNFPTPWSGAPNTIFSGNACSSGPCDNGAIRIVNNSASAVTVNSVIASFSTCTFDAWPHTVSLASGSQLILSDTATGATGCPNGGIFDTSDIGPSGANWAGNCTQSGVIPALAVTIDGTTSTFNDSGQVLNTAGVDKAACPAGTTNNESTQWTKVGNVACAGAVLSLAPPTQIKVIGTNATVQATLVNGCGDALQGATVQFGVSSGPNVGLTGSGVTDTNGRASFTYSSSVAGQDALLSAVSNPAGTIFSNTVIVNWILPVTMTGRAFGISNSGSLAPIAPTPDTGSVATTTASSTTTPCVQSIPGSISASVLCANVTTVLGPPTSTARAYVAGASVTPASIVLRGVQATSTSNCSNGSSGTTTIAFLKIGTTTVIDTTGNPTPNTTINLGVVKVVLNEQIPFAGGLTVNAVHITVGTLLNVIVSSATSDIHDCSSGFSNGG